MLALLMVLALALVAVADNGGNNDFIMANNDLVSVGGSRERVRNRLC